MTSLLTRSKWAILALPLAAPSCNGGGGGGNNPSPSTSLLEWMNFDIANWLPTGISQAIHHLPMVNWLT